MMQLELLPAIDQLRLVAEGMQIVPGRIIHVQEGSVLPHQRRIRVLDDFAETKQPPVAEVICSQNAVEAVTSALQIQFGVQQVIKLEKRFNEQKTTLKYQLPQGENRRQTTIISEPDNTQLSRR